MELQFTVWQFVRLMVHLESHPDAQFEAWQDVWQTLDATLTDLSGKDGAAYSDMMMNQDVVIEDATSSQAKACEAALKTVMTELEAAIEAADDEDETLLSLKFERRELRQLTRKLKRLGEEN